MSARDRLAAGYTGPSAAAFEEDPKMEALAALADSNPARFDRISPTMRMQLGFYLQAKAATKETTK